MKNCGASLPTNEENVNDQTTAKSKRAEEETERLASFPKLNPNPIVEIDYEGNIKYVNPAAKTKLADLEALSLKHPLFADFENMIRALKEKDANSYVSEVKVGNDWYLEQCYKVPRTQFVRIYALNITERKKAEEALQSSEKQKNDILESITDGFVAFDKEWRYTYVNSNAARILHASKEELIGKVAIEVFPKASKFLAEFKRAVSSGHPVHFEEYYPEPLNIWYECHCYPSQDGLTVFFSDITQRKKAEEALRNVMQQTESNRKRFETILEKSPSAIVIVEAPDGRFSLVNRHAQELYGIDFRGVDLATNVAKVKASRPDGTAYAVDEVPASRALNLGEEVRNEEMIISRADGAAIPVLVSAGPIRDAQGSIAAAIVIFEDITERKKMEEKVKQGMQTFVELIERAPFGIYVIDSQFRIAHMNTSSQNGAFRNVRPLIGRDFNEAMHILWPEPTASEILSNFRYTLETGEPYYSPKFINPRHDVEIVEAYEWELQRIKLPDGQHGVICYYFDSTKLRETERSLNVAQAKLKEYATNLEHLVEERTKQLKDSERLAAIGATAGMVGHDIRNPLQAITSDIYLIKTELSLTPETDEKKNAIESLTEIEKNIDYINKIVQDLQDYARPLQPTAKGTDLENLCQEVFLKSNIPNNIKTFCKAEKEAKQVMADPDLLKRVISNLVLNAVQAMPKGGKLSIHAYREEGGLVIEVQDTGEGISEEVKAKMFTPLFTTKSKGQGFGLAVVKRVTESMNGAVTFENEHGKGTKFIVRLPPPKERAER